MEMLNTLCSVNGTSGVTEKAPLWEVRDGNRVIAMAASQFQARVMCEEPDIDTGEPRTIRKTTPGTFAGRVFRPFFVEWWGYFQQVFFVDYFRKHPEEFVTASPLNSEAERIRGMMIGTGLTRRAILQDIENFCGGKDTVSEAAPSSVLAIPRVLYACPNHEDPILPGEYGSRDDAFNAVVANNRQQLEESEKYTRWGVVVEVGEPIETYTPAISNLTGGVGVEEFHIRRPIRLVRPTDEDIARYAAE